jgi:hypothetical protein
MENKEISNYPELVLHIMHLKQEKFRQEEEIKYTIRELIYLLNPLTIIKQGLHNLATDAETRFDMLKVGLSMGTSMLANRIMRNRSGITGFIGKLLLGKFSSSVIGRNLTNIVSGITNRLRPTPSALEENPKNYSVQ